VNWQDRAHFIRTPVSKEPDPDLVVLDDAFESAGCAG